MSTSRYFVLAILLSLSFASPTQATLFGRLPSTPGGTDWQAYYDDQLHITWTSNANINGADSWAAHTTWASTFAIGGIDGWRLPNMDRNGDQLIVDCSASGAPACLDNELGYMYYQNGVNPSSPGPFSNLQLFAYWSATDVVSDPNSAWSFDFTGSQYTSLIVDGAYSWAVHDGDVAAPLDIDSDGIEDLTDNCLFQENPDQRDTDNDNIGNRCDTDLNNDCTVNAVDLGIFRSRFFSNDSDADFEGDGVVNAVDLGILRAAFFKAPGPSGTTTNCNAISDMTYFTNTDLPLLFGMTLPTGELVTVAGGKDDQGSFTGLDSILVETSQGNNGSIKFNGSGRPAEVYAVDGSRLEFDWQDGAHATISFRAADGSFETAIEIDTASSVMGAAAWSQPSVAHANSGQTFNFHAESATTRNSGSSQGTIEVDVTSLDRPVERAQVTINVGRTQPPESYSVPVTEVGGGVYLANFPGAGPIVPSEQIETQCRDVVGKFLMYCQVGAPISWYMISVGCIQLAAEVALLHPAAAAAVLAACETAFAVNRGVCLLPIALGDSQPEVALCSIVADVVEWSPSVPLSAGIIANKSGMSGTDLKFFSSGDAFVTSTINLPPIPFGAIISAPATGTCGASINLSPGQYQMQNIQAWNAWNGQVDLSMGIGWEIGYLYFSSTIGNGAVGPGGVFSSAAAAVAAADLFEFTLHEPDTITVSCWDTQTSDNAGGLTWTISGQLFL